MIATWFFVGLIVLTAIVITICVSIASEYTIERKSSKVVIVLIAWVVSISICGLLLWHLYGTESGRRAQKSFRSETHGGLIRTVKVYDMQGDLIQEYKGKFDIEENQTGGIVKVKFDCDGKRHIVYCSTGTVVIDEN